MENVVLTIHLILALLLIGVVLLQRSEGGGLGIGGGGGTVSARGAATALTKLTWIFASAFIVTSIALTVLATRGGQGGSVVDSVATDGVVSSIEHGKHLHLVVRPDAPVRMLPPNEKVNFSEAKLDIPRRATQLTVSWALPKS